MNDLTAFLRATARDETHYMNLLQTCENPPISDLCVSANDVSAEDAKRAVERIKEW